MFLLWSGVVLPPSQLGPQETDVVLFLSFFFSSISRQGCAREVLAEPSRGMEMWTGAKLPSALAG
jgi:hypothetical protein